MDESLNICFFIGEVSFAQLLGMCDFITLTLANGGEFCVWVECVGV